MTILSAVSRFLLIGAISRVCYGASLPWAITRTNLPGYKGRAADGSCPIFPDNSPWHLDVSSLPKHPQSSSIIAKISTSASMHNDFGGGEKVGGKKIRYGIPFNITDTRKGQTFQTVKFFDYGDESDNKPYPIPATAAVEGSWAGCPAATCDGDRHVLVVNNATCMLYELYNARVDKKGKWSASSGAIFNLSSNKLRPLGWTSADAAGLPLYPGLIKYKETVVTGYIDHAIRFTGPNSRRAYQLPAEHFAPHGDTGASSPWMGMRVRLGAAFDCTQLKSAAGKTICTAMKRFGLIFADNGSPWFLTGEANVKWDPILDPIHADLAKIKGSDMEVVDTGVCLCLDADCTKSEPGGASTTCS